MGWSAGGGKFDDRTGKTVVHAVDFTRRRDSAVGTAAPGDCRVVALRPKPPRGDLEVTWRRSDRDGLAIDWRAGIGD